LWFDFIFQLQKGEGLVKNIDLADLANNQVLKEMMVSTPPWRKAYQTMTINLLAIIGRLPT
jgi:hypothetical protein